MSDKKQNFIFQLASPQYRKMLDFISENGKVSPAKMLNDFIYQKALEDVNKLANKLTHKHLDPKSGLLVADVEWVRGEYSSDWKKLADTIDTENAIKYQSKFLPLFDKYFRKIQTENGFELLDLEGRYDLAESK
jgi:hypothetical protein